MKATSFASTVLAAMGCGLLPFSAATHVWAQTNSASSQERPRIYVTDSTSWEVRSSGGGSDAAFGTASSGGARPQTAEIIKTFGERCPSVMVNNRQEMSDYVVQLDHEGGKSVLSHRNKIVVFVRSSGDSIFSKSTLSLGGSVQEACAVITRHWTDHSAELRNAAPSNTNAKDSRGATSNAVSSQTAPAQLNISSNPTGADIEINGSFVGNTPSSIEIHPGEQTISITKKGYQPWVRKLSVTGGAINVNVELEKLPTSGEL